MSQYNIITSKLTVRNYLSESKNFSASSERIAVPTPLLVNISRRRQCGILPSRICTLDTPCSIASIQLLSLGSIPPPIVPLSKSVLASEVESSDISESLSSKSLYTPSISVKNASFSALTALAIAHAASSALILYAWKSSSYPIGHITGKNRP